LKLDDHYEVLGVDRVASLGTLKRAFRTRLLTIHPDCNPQDQLAVERTREVIEAYEVLSNPPKRREYDCALNQVVRPVGITYREIDAEVPLGLAKVVSAAVVIGFAIYLLVTLIVSMLANRTPVFTFCVAAMLDTTVPRTPPQLLDPSISDCMEWYHTKQLQVGLVNRWLVGEAVKVYSDAVARAERRGDLDRARFYKATLDDIRVIDSAEVGGLVREPGHEASSQSPSRGGAKRAFASS